MELKGTHQFVITFFACSTGYSSRNRGNSVVYDIFVCQHLWRCGYFGCEPETVGLLNVSKRETRVLGDTNIRGHETTFNILYYNESC